MLVYHTSNVKISKPDVLHSRDNLDFGKGFYVTKLKEQAEKYAERFTRLGQSAFMHVYEFSPSQTLVCKKFEAYDEEWLKFISICRNGGNEYLVFDIIEGGVADDKVYRTVDFFMQNIYTIEQALQQLKYQKPNHQMCFISQKAIDKCLKFVECIKISK